MASVTAMSKQEAAQKTDSAVSKPEVTRKLARQFSKASTAASEGDRSLSPATSPTRGVPSSAVLGDDRSCGGHYRSAGIRAQAPAKPAATPPACALGGLPSSAVTGPDGRGAWKWW